MKITYPASCPTTTHKTIQRGGGYFYLFAVVMVTILLFFILATTTSVEAKRGRNNKAHHHRRQVHVKKHTIRSQKRMKKSLTKLLKKFYGGRNNGKYLATEESKSLHMHLSRVESRLRRMLNQLENRYKKLSKRTKQSHKKVLEKKKAYRKAQKIYKKYLAKYGKATKTTTTEQQTTYETATNKLKEYQVILEREVANLRKFKKAWINARKLRRQHNNTIRRQLDTIDSLRSMMGKPEGGESTTTSTTTTTSKN